MWHRLSLLSVTSPYLRQQCQSSPYHLSGLLQVWLWDMQCSLFSAWQCWCERYYVQCAVSCTSLCWTITFPVVWCSLPICPSCSDEIWQSNSVLGWYCIRYQSTLNMPASVLMVLLKHRHHGLSFLVQRPGWGPWRKPCPAVAIEETSHWNFSKLFCFPLMHWLVATCIYGAPQVSLGFHQSSPRLYCFDLWIPSN